MGADTIDTLSQTPAGKLDSTAAYVRSHHVAGILINLRQVVARNPTPFLVLAVSLGFLAGSAVRQIARLGTARVTARFPDRLQPIELLRQPRSGNGWIRTLIEIQDILSKLRRHPRILLLSESSDKLRESFVGSLVLASL
jgi:hypothetical protein